MYLYFLESVFDPNPTNKVCWLENNDFCHIFFIIILCSRQFLQGSSGGQIIMCFYFLPPEFLVSAYFEFRGNNTNQSSFPDISDFRHGYSKKIPNSLSWHLGLLDFSVIAWAVHYSIVYEMNSRSRVQELISRCVLLGLPAPSLIQSSVVDLLSTWSQVWVAGSSIHS